MSLAREHHISTDIKEIKEKRAIKDQNGGNSENGQKINFKLIVAELGPLTSTKQEEDFVAVLLDKDVPSRKHVTNISENSKFVTAVIQHMTKQIVYLYKGINSTIDDYLESDEDKYIDTM